MQHPTRVCSWCGASYGPRRVTQWTCSKDCSRLLKNHKSNARRHPPLTPRPCPTCGVVYTPKRSDAAACSSQCRQRLKYVPRSNWHDKTCEVCAEPFRAKRSDARRCSSHCNNLAKYAANRDARIEAARAWQIANRDRRHVTYSRYKARRRGWEAAGDGVSARDWRRLLERYGHRCAYCGQDGPMQMEHVIPLSRGGLHTIGNVVPACPPCNNSKNDKLLTEWTRRPVIA